MCAVRAWGAAGCERRFGVTYSVGANSDKLTPPLRGAQCCCFRKEMNFAALLAVCPVSDESARFPWRVALLWVMTLGSYRGCVLLPPSAGTFPPRRAFLPSPVPAKQVAGFKSPLSVWSSLSTIAHQRPVLLQNID